MLKLFHANVTGCWNKKLPNFLQKFHNKWLHQFYSKSATLLHNTRNSCQIFGLFLCDNLQPRNIKIAHLVTLRVPADSGPMAQSVIRHKVGDDAIAVGIDAVNQGNWSLSIQWRLECFVFVAYYKQYAKALTYSQNDSKIQGCIWCQYFLS